MQERPDDTLIGLIDIGSNSIRLVIYRAGGRLPQPQFNEREVCRLGEGVSENNILTKEATQHALSALRRYALIAIESNLDRLEVFATEAVRQAKNQHEFIKPAEEILKTKIRILSGYEEADYAARGVISGFFSPDGVVADLGGGSLELMPIRGQAPEVIKGAKNSLPLGYLNEVGEKEIKEALSEFKWLKDWRGTQLYVVGGAWRALATAFSVKSKRRLDIVHGLELMPVRLFDLMEEIEASGGEVEGIPPARRPNMWQAIKVMRVLLKVVKPDKVIFSSYGAREGILYEQLSVAPDPLLAGVKEYADMWQRHEGLGKALSEAMEGFISFLPKKYQRLGRAVSFLADITWLDFPDYRAPLAVDKMLGLSVVGITHSERIWMAAVLYVRYRGAFPEKGIFRGRLSRKERKSACFIGLALRMLMTLSGGIPALITPISITAEKKTLTIAIPKDYKKLDSQLIERRIEAITKYSSAKIIVP